MTRQRARSSIIKLKNICGIPGHRASRWVGGWVGGWGGEAHGGMRRRTFCPLADTAQMPGPRGQQASLITPYASPHTSTMRIPCDTYHNNPPHPPKYLQIPNDNETFIMKSTVDPTQDDRGAHLRVEAETATGSLRSSPTGSWRGWAMTHPARGCRLRCRLQS